jgi:hypothetical protein
MKMKQSIINLYLYKTGFQKRIVQGRLPWTIGKFNVKTELLLHLECFSD